MAYLDICRLLPHSTAPASFSVVPLHRPASASTLAMWLSKYLALACVNTAIFQQHSTPAAAAAYTKHENSIAVKQIYNIECWTSISGIFEKFYARY